MGIEMNACNPAPGRQRQREWEEVEASLDTVSKVNKQGAVTIHKPHKPPKQRTGGQGQSWVAVYLACTELWALPQVP